MEMTAPAVLAARFEAQRRAFLDEPFPTRAARLSRLDRLFALVDANEAAIIEAIDADFSGRAPQETQAADLVTVRAGIRHARRHLSRWMRTRRIPTDLHFRPGWNRLTPQPLGVVGVVSPWNYPLQLALMPALGALAAGNRVMIKPSELTPVFSGLLAKLVAGAFDAAELTVVAGDAETGKAFAALPFDHLFFTGSTAVGRAVAQAAAANLTPVTLELGGKSPAILDPSCDLETAARRIAYGKLFNAGQTCVAPDYLLVPKGRAEEVAGRIAAAMARMYPSLVTNPDYTAIISQHHRQRLVALVEEARQAGARIVEVNPAGERFDPAAARKLAPVLVIGAPEESGLMREEIFGPVLPIVEYDGLDAAVARVRAGGHPLALYWFGTDAANRERVLRETLSGGVAINDCLWQFVQEGQPCGGVGASGMGAYHGQWGFDTFSKLKPVFHQSRLSGTALLRPPYGRAFELLSRVLRRLG
jgi:coniferyl-aldehyde dehydrogenase